MLITPSGGHYQSPDDTELLVRPSTPFRDWSIDVARSVINVPPWLITNRRFVSGDHWQDQSGWVGPHPRWGDADYIRGWQEIARCFTSENVVNALIERRANGVVGREPMWKLTPRVPKDDKGTPSDEDKRLITEATEALTPWWNDRGCHERIYEWLCIMFAGYRATTRLFLPPGFFVPATANGVAARAVRQVGTIDEALALLYVSALQPERATVYENPETMQAAGVYLYGSGDGSYSGLDRAEVSWVDPATRSTFIRSVGYGATAGAGSVVNLGGRLPMFEAQHRPFITEQVRQLQRAYNLALTLLPHNLVTGGWLEMIVLQGQMPGYFKKDPATGKPTNEWVGIDMPRGAHLTQWIAPQQFGKLADQSTQLTSPSVVFRPPSDVAPVIESHESLYTRMLDAANQVHVLLSQDGSASGRSREVARNEFAATLRQPGARVQHLGRWLLETTLAYVELLTGQPGKYTSKLRVEFTCRYDVGPIAADERAANLADVKDGLLSENEAMERAGVEDVDAMRADIAMSPRGQLGLSTQQAEAVQLWLDTGLSFKGALKAAHVDEDLAAELLTEYDGQPPAPEMGGVPNVPPVPGGGNGNNGQRPPRRPVQLAQ